jgi:hypothetical protein
MKFSVRQMSVRARLGFLALAPILLLFGLLILFPPDGVERAEWAQFIGRFHLLTIHFPIALILLAPVLKLAGRARLSFATILAVREINSLHTFLNPSVCYHFRPCAPSSGSGLEQLPAVFAHVETCS